MANTLKADIAKELNITARRNDSFKLALQVKDNGGNIVMNGTHNTSYPEYQAKMTIINNSGDRVLNIYSYYWRDVVPTENSTTHPEDLTPSSSAEGHYTGSNSSSMGIYLQGQTVQGASTQTASITVPHDYMDFQSGTYKYDLQIRKKTAGDVGEDNDAEFTTWLYGKFILNADITQS